MGKGGQLDHIALDHVAIVVPDLAAARALYRDVLGARVSEPRDLPEHGVSVVFVELANTRIELLHPLGAESPVARFLARNPAGGLHHICVGTGDLGAAQARAAAAGVRVLGEAKPGAQGDRVLFLHPRDMAGALVEIEETAGASRDKGDGA